MAEVLQGIWEDVLTEIRGRIPPERFGLWFRNTELLDKGDQTCCVGVPNAFVGEWLQEHFSDVVKGAVGKITGEDVRVRFVVSPRLYRDSHEEEVRQKQELVEALDTSRRSAPTCAASERAYSLEGFVVGPCNRLAYAAGMHVAQHRDRSLNPLVIHGAVGLGKTHLVKGICAAWNESEPGKALYLSGESFTNQFLASLQHNSFDGFRRKFRDIEMLALDDLQFLADKPATQDEFLQVYKFLTELNKQVVLSSDSPPMEIAKLRQTLQTRLVSGMIVRLDKPDYETRLAILEGKLGTHRGLVGDEVMRFIAESVTGSVRELEGAATTLIATATLTREKIDLSTARRAVASLMPANRRRLTVERIEDAVVRHYGVRLEDIHSTRRHRSVALPRHVAMYLARELTSMSWKEIGTHFGRRNHTGALFAHNKIKDAIGTDAILADCVRRLRVELEG